MNNNTIKKSQIIKAELKRHLDAFDKAYDKENQAFTKGAARKMIEVSGEHLIEIADTLATEVREQTLKDLVKTLKTYQCDFNWDFKKKKPKHESYIKLSEVLKQLQSQEEDE